MAPAFSILIFALAARCETNKIEHSGELKNISIEGVTRLSIQGDKPVYAPKPDPLPEVQDYLGGQVNRANTAPKILGYAPNFLPTRLASESVLSPWRGNVLRGPEQEIAVDIPPGAAIPASWRVVISDDKGQIFQTLKGKGKLPRPLVWNGKGHSGDVIRVGVPFIYSVYIIDRDKIPSSVGDKTILLKGMVEHGSKPVISLDTKVLFDANSKLTEAGSTLLRQARDIVRKSSRKSLSVDVWAQDPDQAQKQADIIAHFMSSALFFPDNRVTAKGRALEKDRYVRTEIAAK